MTQLEGTGCLPPPLLFLSVWENTHSVVLLLPDLITGRRVCMHLCKFAFLHAYAFWSSSTKNTVFSVLNSGCGCLFIFCCCIFFFCTHNFTLQLGCCGHVFFFTCVVLTTCCHGRQQNEKKNQYISKSHTWTRQFLKQLYSNYGLDTFYLMVSIFL